MKNKTNKNSNTGYRESNNRKKATVRSTFSDIRGSEQFSLENNVDKFIKDFAKTHDATKYNIKIFKMQIIVQKILLEPVLYTLFVLKIVGG